MTKLERLRKFVEEAKDADFVKVSDSPSNYLAMLAVIEAAQRVSDYISLPKDGCIRDLFDRLKEWEEA